MSKAKKYVKVSLLTLLVFASAVLVSILLRDVMDISEHVTAVFTFAVFIISLVTEGYWYGFISAIAGAITINYVFTYPYFDMDFSVPESIFLLLQEL